MENERQQGAYHKRNMVAFVLLGMCNNYSYCVMLAAAHDILKAKTQNDTNSGNSSNVDALVEDCNPIGTGAVLLADILPTLIVKLSAPLYIHIIPYNYRSAVILLCQTASLPIVSFAESVSVSLLGVVFTSISCGLGEITYLSITAHYPKSAIAAWSTGTGVAGVAAALSYAGLVAVGVSPRVTLLIMLICPFIMTITYYWLLKKPPSLSKWTCEPREREQLIPNDETEEETIQPDESNQPEIMNHSEPNDPAGVDVNRGRKLLQSFVINLKLILPLWRYMLPLGLVYLFEYFINQGVFINLVVLCSQVFLQFIPNIWIIFLFILFEGLLGGAAYVNTFYRITIEVEEDRREYSLGVTSIADSLGIAIAGGLAVPAHNWVCTL